jgi:SpoVK/Ycf46/Vps4 family AAA+-type ATPase
VSSDVDWTELIRVTDGYSGADLANVCRDAAMMPMRRKISEGIDIMKI